MLVRPATLDDAEAIRSIYNREVLESTVTFDLVPRTLDEQRSWQRARAGALSVVVAEHEGELLGFGSLSAYRDRPGYRTSVEDSVYVHRDGRGRGVGDALLARLVADARSHGFHAVFARIVGGHQASIALHRKHGFRVVGTEREVGRKFGRWLDVVLMECLVDGGRRRPEARRDRHPALGFLDAANEHRADERRALLEASLAPEFRYVDPALDEPVRGLGEVEELFAGRLERWPGWRIEPRTPVEEHHDVWRIAWREAGGDGSRAGTFTGEVDPTGRILRIEAFTDHP